MENVKFNGWDCIRLANSQVELIVTREVGPRIVRLAFLNERNLFAEIEGHQGGRNEAEWMNRGGHRFWVAPEAKPWSYELDNSPYESAEEIPNGVRTYQTAGPVTGLSKQMEITLSPDAAEVKIRHTLKNCTKEQVRCAPWALSVVAQTGRAIIPLPAKIAHTERLTHNQQWSLWGYTDLSDARWKLGGRYVMLQQDPACKGPTKIGIAHDEKWVAYQLGEFVFVKYFRHFANAEYPDGGCSFETFTDKDILELESLGPLVTLAPGATTEHTEHWKLFRGVAACATEDDVDANVRPLV